MRLGEHSSANVSGKAFSSAQHHCADGKDQQDGVARQQFTEPDAVSVGVVLGTDSTDGAQDYEDT